MRTLSLLLLAVVLAVGSGCKKKQPSQEFTDASTQFAALYGEKLDEAYLDPAMDDIVSKLQRVPEDSTDTQAAKELLARIETGRAKLREQAAAREAAKAEALKTQVVPFNPTNTGTTQTNTQVEPPPQAATPDAGPNVAVAPRPGMTLAEFDKAFGDCFDYGVTIFLEGAGQGAADSRTLKDLNRCKDRLPGYEGKMVLFQNGSVVNIVNKADIKAVTPEQDGGNVDRAP